MLKCAGEHKRFVNEATGEDPAATCVPFYPAEHAHLQSPCGAGACAEQTVSPQDRVASADFTVAHFPVYPRTARVCYDERNKCAAVGNSDIALFITLLRYYVVLWYYQPVAKEGCMH